jgi:hypothetical protein
MLPPVGTVYWKQSNIQMEIYGYIRRMGVCGGAFLAMLLPYGLQKHLKISNWGFVINRVLHGLLLTEGERN